MVATPRQSYQHSRMLMNRYKKEMEFIEMLPPEMKPYVKNIVHLSADKGDAFQIDFGYPVYSSEYDIRSTRIFGTKKELKEIIECELDMDEDVKGDLDGDNEWGLVEQEDEDFSKKTYDIMPELKKKYEEEKSDYEYFAKVIGAKI